MFSPKINFRTNDSRLSCCSFSLIIALLCSVGCSSSLPEKATTTGVTGTVTLDGKPVTTGYVAFIPLPSENAEAEVKMRGGGVYEADLDASGKFAFDKGVTIAKYKVIVSPLPRTPTDPSIDLKKVKKSIPQKYQTEKTTDLTADVESGGGEFNFDLKN